MTAVWAVPITLVVLAGALLALTFTPSHADRLDGQPSGHRLTEIVITCVLLGVFALLSLLYLGTIP